MTDPRLQQITGRAAHAVGCTAQAAGGVPAMCDGVTQGTAGPMSSGLSYVEGAVITAVAEEHRVIEAPSRDDDIIRVDCEMGELHALVPADVWR